MASVLNRTTKEYRIVADTSGFPPAEWIINSAQADALFAAGVPSYYWNIVGDVVTEMTAAEKAAFDLAGLNRSRDLKLTDFNNVEDILRALVQVLIDEVNTLRVAAGLPARTLAQLRTAIRNKLGT